MWCFYFLSLALLIGFYNGMVNARPSYTDILESWMKYTKKDCNHTSSSDELSDETLLCDMYLKDLIGMLEYDSAYEAPRKHSEFLCEIATFREVLPIANDELKEKIHQIIGCSTCRTYAFRYPHPFEENLLPVLNSYLFFNRIDIVNMLQKDKRSMKELFD
ncbi:hypothetical protein GCK32_004575 [Trichostrongylus colubriformis]|uniref:Serine/threonine-protein phosphatase 4 regulatory subunit 3-like central domain-containing protein n=1 Tax=Trichostrongylus colubriformis TaxID=6319 RepID=A0AAN8FQC6_TRICO